MEKTKGNITSDQRKELVDFIKSHPQLNSGKFTNDFTYKKAQQLWESLANNLNAMPGANKDWKKWRKTWHDIKTRTKSKKSMIKQHRNRTGGGPPIDIQISTEEDEILGIMGPVVVDGHQDILESQVEFDGSSITNLLSPVQVDMEHDYCWDITNNELNASNDNIPSNDNVPVLKENNPPLELTSLSKVNISENRKVKRPRRLERLEKTISATAELSKQTERDISMRNSYYNKKIELYEKDVNAKLRIASALERIAKCKED